ncbi:MAG: ABC transporter substrate-binding protein [Burkholderiaceae bacterium]
MSGARDSSRRAWLAGAAALAASSWLAPARAAAPAPRVVSVGGALTEIVWALGASDTLVGIDTTSTWPAAARALPKVGYPRMLSAEGLLSLSPSLVLTTADAGPATVLSQISRAGVRLLTAAPGHDIDSLIANVSRVADGLGRPAAGAALSDRLRLEWAATRAAVGSTSAPQVKPPRVLFVFSHAANNVQVAGTDTAADAMIRLAGGVNAMSGFAGYRPLASEAVVAAAPDVILATREGLGALGGVEALLGRPGLSLTPAARSRRVLSFDTLYLLGFGPRLPQAVRELAAGLGTAA